MKRLVKYAAGIALVALCNTSTFADTLYVSASAARGGDGSQERPFTSIQAAINAAPSGSQINVKGGSYQENLQMLGKNLTLQGTGPTQAETQCNVTVNTSVTIVSANQQPVVSFYGYPGCTVTFRNFIFQGGQGQCFPAPSNACFGGGVYITSSDGQGSNFQAFSCRFQDNVTDYGGGIYVDSDGSGCGLNTCIIAGNVAKASLVAGAAINNYSGNPQQVVLQNVAICGNTEIPGVIDPRVQQVVGNATHLGNYCKKPACTGNDGLDTNGDGIVDRYDLPGIHQILGVNRGDLDLDGCVNVNDVLILLSSYGNGCGTP